MSIPNVYSLKSNFTGGEWSPELEGRVDIPQFETAANSLVNFIPTPFGGIKTAPGTVCVSDAVAVNSGRLIDFLFNTEQAYVVELNTNYCRFYANNGRVEDTAKNVELVDSSGGLFRITITGHGYSNGDHVRLRNLLGVPQINRDWAVSNVTADTFTLAASTYAAGYTSGGTVRKIIEVVSPWLAEDLTAIRVTQDADTMYLFHADYATQKLVRVSATSFTLSEVDWEVTPFDEDDTNSAITITPSGTSGNIVVNSSAAIFTADRIGQHMRIANGAVKITAIVNSTDANANVRVNIVAVGTTNWAWGAWGILPGWPSVGLFYEDRLVTGKIQTLDGSKTGEYENFDMFSTADNYAWEYNLVSRQANLMRWMAADDLLFIGTSGREFKVTGGNESGITPTSVLARPTSKHGSYDVDAVETTSGIVFVQRSGTKARLISYSFDKDKYQATDLTLLSNRMLTGGVAQIAYQAEPYENIWFAKSAGNAAVLTLLSDQNVTAWSRFHTSGTVKSVAVIPTSTLDQVWMLVQRVIDGETRQYVEYLDATVNVDCAVTATFNSAVTSITSGLEYLEGKEVTIVADGAVSTAQTVTDGALPAELDFAATSITFGLAKPTPTIRLFLPHQKFQDGTTVGRRLKVTRVILAVLETIGLSVDGNINPTMATSENMDTAPDKETTLLEWDCDLDWNEPVTITQHLPFGAHIKSVTQYVEVGD